MSIMVYERKGQVPVTVLALEGETGITPADRMESCAREIITAGARDLVINLQTPYLGRSEIIAIDRILLFMLADQSCKDFEAMHRGIHAGTFKSPHFKLVCPSPYALQALSMAGVDTYLEIYRDLPQAIGSFVPNPQRERIERGKIANAFTSRRSFENRVVQPGTDLLYQRKEAHVQSTTLLPVAVVPLRGILDGARLAALAKETDDPWAQRVTNLILDLQNECEISSGGLVALQAIAGRFSSRGGKVILCGVSKTARRVMEVTGYIKFFSIFPSADAAYASFSPLVAGDVPRA